MQETSIFSSPLTWLTSFFNPQSPTVANAGGTNIATMSEVDMANAGGTNIAGMTGGDIANAGGTNIA